MRAAIVAISSAAAPAVSVFRKSRTGAARLRAHAVRLPVPDASTARSLDRRLRRTRAPGKRPGSHERALGATFPRGMDFWVYVVGPVVGAPAGGLAYEGVRGRSAGTASSTASAASPASVHSSAG